MSKFLSNGLKVLFNINECIVGGSDNEVIAIMLRGGNLYQMTFMKVCRVDAANLVRLSTEGGMIDFWGR